MGGGGVKTRCIETEGPWLHWEFFLFCWSCYNSFACIYRHILEFTLHHSNFYCFFCFIFIYTFFFRHASESPFLGSLFFGMGAECSDRICIRCCGISFFFFNLIIGCLLFLTLWAYSLNRRILRKQGRVFITIGSLLTYLFSLQLIVYQINKDGFI